MRRLDLLLITHLLLLLRFELVASLIPCTVINATLPPTNDTVNVACTSVVFLNVVARGNMMVNVSIAGLAVSSVGSMNITISLTNVSLLEGATLVIDSTGYVAGSSSPYGRLSVMIQSLYGRNAAVVFVGSLPPSSTIVIRDANITSDNQSTAPYVASLDPFSDRAKMLVFINFTLTSGSLFAVERCSLVVTVPITCSPLYTTGSLIVTNSSILSFYNSTIVATNNAVFRFTSAIVGVFGQSTFQFVLCTLSSNSNAAYIFKSSVQISGSSTWTFSLCTLAALSDYTFFMGSSFAMISEYSSWIFASSNLTSSAKGSTYYFFVTSGFNITLVGGSGWYMSNNTMLSNGNSTTGTRYVLAFTANSSISLDDRSFWLVTGNTISTTTSQAPPILFDASSPLLIRNMSWVLWSSNNMSSGGNDTCVQFQSSLVIMTGGYMSVIKNNCTSSGWMWRNATGQTAVSGGGTLYQRCNLQNGTLTTAAGLPSTAIGAGSCGVSCNASAECFAPLTVIDSVCKLSLQQKAVECTCLPGGGGNLCLPGTTKASFSPSLSTDALSKSWSCTRPRSSGSVSESTSNSETASLQALSLSSVSHETRSFTRSRISHLVSLSTSPSGSTSRSGAVHSLSPSATSTRNDTSYSSVGAVTTTHTSTTCLSPSSSGEATYGTLQGNTPSTATMTKTLTSDPCESVELASTTREMLQNVTASPFMVMLNPIQSSSNATIFGNTTTDRSALNSSFLIGCTYSDLAASPGSVNITLANNRQLKFGALRVLLPLPILEILSPSPVSTSVISASTIMFTIAPIYYDKYSTRSVRITIPASAFYCEGRSTNVSLELLISGSQAPPPATTAQTAAKTATAIGSVVAVASFSPTAAAQIARIGAMQSISACVFTNDDVPIGFAGGSFTSLVVGSTPGMYLRGAVVGNSLVIIVGSCILVLIIALWTVLEQVKYSVARRHAPSFQQGGSDKVGLLATIGRACELGRVPSVYFPVYVVFAPSTVGFGVTLFSISPLSNENIAIALLICLVGIAYATAVTYNLHHQHLNLELGPVKWPPGILNRSSLLVTLCHPMQRWVVRDPQLDPWRKRNRLLFDDFDRWWYGLIDLWTSLAVGVVNGIQVSSREVCATQIAVMLIIFLVVFCLGVFLDPCMSRSLRYYLNASNAMGLLSCCMLVAAIRTDSALLLDLSNWFMMALSSISICKLVVDIVYVLYRFVRSLDVAIGTGTMTRGTGAAEDDSVVVVMSSEAEGTRQLKAPCLASDVEGHVSAPHTLEMVLLQDQVERASRQLDDGASIDLDTLLLGLDDSSPEQDFSATVIGAQLQPTEQARRTKGGDFDVFGLAREDDMNMILHTTRTGLDADDDACVEPSAGIQNISFGSSGRASGEPFQL